MADYIGRLDTGGKSTAVQHVSLTVTESRLHFSFFFLRHTARSTLPGLVTSTQDKDIDNRAFIKYSGNERYVIMESESA